MPSTKLSIEQLNVAGTPSATTYLRGDKTWATVVGGSATPSGANTQVQFNNAGAFGGSSDLTFDDATKTLSLNGVDTDISLRAITNEPATPPVGTGLIYTKYISGKLAIKIKGQSGLDSPLQNAFWQNNITMWNPTNVTAGVWLGSVGATTGTYTRALPISTAVYTSIVRSRYSNVVTTLNQVLGCRNTEAMFTRGSLSRQGGFFFYARVGMDVWTNGGRFFTGMHTATTVISADPSALNNTMGFCVDAADNGAISFLTRDTVATKATTPFTIVSNKGYDLYMFCAPNSTQVTWRIKDINLETEASGVATLTLPANTTLLTAGVLASNAALTPVTSIQLGINRIYVETDY
jgi:hypothetical protein